MSTDTIIAISIGAIFAIVTIIQTWRIHEINKRHLIRRSIKFFYEIKKTISFEDLPYDLKIEYKSNHYKNIFIIEGIIGNDSNVVFTNGDLLKPLVINSTKVIKILNHEVIDQTKDEMEFKIIQSTNNGNDFIEVFIDNFEPKDAFKFRLLIASEADNLELILNGLIKNENVGINPKTKQITGYDYRGVEVDRGHQQETMYPIYFAIIMGIILGIYFLFIGIQQLFYLWLKEGLNFTLVSSEILSFILAILVYLGLIFLVIRLAKKIKNKKKKTTRSKEPSLTGFGPWFDLKIRSKDLDDYFKYPIVK